MSQITMVCIIMLLGVCLDDARLEAMELPEAASSQAQLMQAKCGLCHALPQPNIHAPRFWPGIVYRMQLHMKTQGVGSLTDAEMSVLVNYLQRHAGAKGN